MNIIINEIPGRMSKLNGHATYPDDFPHLSPTGLDFVSWRVGADIHVETTLNETALEQRLKTLEETELKKPLYQRLLDAGIPKTDMDHHRSDLYVRKTSVSTVVIDQYFEETGHEKDLFVSTFWSQDENPSRQWYEVAFAYTPFWNNPD